MKTVRIGLAGFGTVGYGTYETLKENADLICKRAGCRVEIARILVRNVAKAQAKAPEVATLVTSDMQALVQDPTIDIVVEVMGGIDTAKTLIEAAIAAGKNVVTANKYLLAKYGNELFEKARCQGVKIFYEAAVAGGIPIIKALREGLTANPVRLVAGIVNGTCNYILTTMREEGKDFSEVLKDAQALGYAEADPTFDIEGIDASHKLSLMCAIAFGTDIHHEGVHTKGITSVSSDAIACAEKKGYRIKLIAYGAQTEQGIQMMVTPMFVSKQLHIAWVEGATNAVSVQSEGLGETVYIGKGAGSRPTASAVVADIVDCVRGCSVPFTGVVAESVSQGILLDATECKMRHALMIPEALKSEIGLKLGDAVPACQTDRVGSCVICITPAMSTKDIQSILGKEHYAAIGDYPILEA